MALKSCRECGAPVSSDAITCPKCGAPEPVRTYGVSHLLGILMVMWLIYMAASGSSSDEARPASTSVTNPPAVAADVNMIKASEALPTEATMNNLRGAVQDPERVAVLECLGVKVYEDPQPEGHPPSAEACAAIKAKIDRRAEEMRQAATAASAVEVDDSAIQAFKEVMPASAPSVPPNSQEP